METVSLRLLSSCWQIREDKQAQQAVLDVTHPNYPPLFLGDLMTIESCLQMEKLSSHTDPLQDGLTMTVECDTATLFGLEILSEARNIEVYSLPYSEYMMTIKAQPAEPGGEDDLAAYLTSVRLPTPLHRIVIKFVSLETPNLMWLFGIRVILHATNQKSVPPPVSAARKIRPPPSLPTSKLEQMQMMRAFFQSHPPPKRTSTANSESLHSGQTTEDTPLNGTHCSCSLLVRDLVTQFNNTLEEKLSQLSVSSVNQEPLGRLEHKVGKLEMQLTAVQNQLTEMCHLLSALVPGKIGNPISESDFNNVT